MEAVARPGLLIVLEGGEGAGKSTQAQTLYLRLLEERQPTLLLHEPGGTPLGENIRRLLKGQRGEGEGGQRGRRATRISPMAELLLFSAARAQLVERVLGPALREGQVVVCDRYTPSTLAYQGFGRGIPREMVREITRAATGGLAPDLVILLDLDAEEGHRRVRAQMTLALGGERAQPPGRQDEEGLRRFEEEPLSFHRRVRRGYRELARANPERWLVLDAALPSATLAGHIWGRVQTLLARAISR